MGKGLDAIKKQVEKNTEVDASAIALLEGLSTKIAELKDDPDALQAFADKLGADSEKLAAAIVANTPAAPETTETTT